MQKKIVVVGGGPGGYVAAIRAAQLGAQVHLAEENAVGGTCLNTGCIPTKALLHVGEFYRQASKNAVAGVKISQAELDWPAAQKYKERVVSRLNRGVAGLLKHNNVTVHTGRARLLPNLKVIPGDSEAALEADAIILATGSENIGLSFPGAELPEVIDSTAALSPERVPQSLVIVGGGVIGVEFAGLYAALGTKVTVVEMQASLLPQMDRQLSEALRAHFKKAGIQVLTGAGLDAVEKASDCVTAVIRAENGDILRIPAERVLVCVGRRARTSGLGLEELGIATERGAIMANHNFETSVPSIFAVGDCNGKAMLAHAASAQGEAAVEYILTGKHGYNGGAVPGCVYTTPEIAAVGMTEQAALEAGIPVKTGIFDLSGNGKTLIENTGAGFVKLVADERDGKILGAHMIGPRVTDIIAEISLCITLGGRAQDVARTIHAHPTVSEAVAEAAMSVFGKAIHGM